MKSICLLGVVLLFPRALLAADPPEEEESITVTVVGTLKTGIVAIGAETTGTTITAKGITWELDLVKNPKAQKVSEKLNGQKVLVKGRLEKRQGVEVKDRWIVTVDRLKAAEKAKAKRKDKRKPGQNE
jgi:hypothetical protein